MSDPCPGRKGSYIRVNPTAAAYRNIVATVGHSRRKTLDRMIAASALVHRLTLVTSNGVDFADIPGLELEVRPRA